MTTFYNYFPDLAVSETRYIIIRGRDDLPDGEYAFLELYCEDTDCDCRRVVIDIIARDTGPKIWATINYGWESSEFYESWMGSKKLAEGIKGASLDPINPQTEYSPVLLQVFEYVLKDEAYVERLKRHYYLFKHAVQRQHRSTRQQQGQRRRVRRRWEL